ncbi:hypothetical protein K502DRAFT_344515 [Neoconidiobolus thromboides FSU 785]|nr:hypothetical protein K502DRAFT_344515 [Neoconidiobolus thromboides FSU 785]
MLSKEELDQMLLHMKNHVDWGYGEDPLKIIQESLKTHFNWKLWLDLIKQFIPNIHLKLKDLHLPDIHQDGDIFELELKNIFLKELFFDTRNVDVTFKNDKDNRKRLIFKFDDIRLTALNIEFNFDKKSGIPRFKESGKLDIILPEKGLAIEMILELEPDLPLILHQIKNFVLDDKEPYSPGLGNGVDEDLFGKILDMQWEMKDEKDIKEDLIKPEDLEKVDDFSDIFSENVFEENSINQEITIDKVEENWIGDLTLLNPQDINKSDEKDQSESDSVNKEIKNILSVLENEEKKVKDAPSFWAWLKGDIEVDMDLNERSNGESKNQNDKENITNDNDDESNTILESNQAISEQLNAIDLMKEDGKTPSSSTSISSCKVGVGSIKSTTGSENIKDPQVTDQKEQNSLLNQMVSSVEIIPKVYQVKAKLHATKRDKLYRFLTPLINHLLKRHLQNSIHQVIQKSIKLWLNQVMAMAYQKFQTVMK